MWVARQMRNAVRRAQRADLLQLDLSPRRGRETARANPGQVASGAVRSVDLVALAEGHPPRGVSAGSAAPGMDGIGTETQSHAVRRTECRGVATVARQKVRPRHARQGRENLSARGD